MDIFGILLYRVQSGKEIFADSVNIISIYS